MSRGSHWRAQLKVLIPLLLLSACTPRYDWRDVRAEDAAWSASFPDKVQTQTRTITLPGQSLNMTMTAARVDETTFAIGAAEFGTDKLPAAAGLDQLRDQLLDALLRNIQGRVQTEQSLNLARLEQGQAPLAARAVTASGKLGDKTVLLSARFAAYPIGPGKAQALQILVLGPQDVLSRPAGQQAIETFMTSVRVR